MQLAHDTDIVAARPIDRDDGFDGQLVFVAHVDDTGSPVVRSSPSKMATSVVRFHSI